MKIKHIIIAGTLLVSVGSFAQKDELKALKKIYNKDVPSAAELQEYKDNLNKLQPLATEEADKVYYNYYKGVLPQIEMAALGAMPTPLQISKLLTPKAISDLAATYSATLEFEKKSGKKVFTDDINEDITAMKPILWQIVLSLDASKKNIETSQVLYSIYQLDKKELDKLYLAANYAMTAQDYAKALEYLRELRAANYTGEGTTYMATNKATDKEEGYQSKDDRDNLVRLGTHIKPREEKAPSKKGEIVKNIALILIEQGKTDEAKEAIIEARKDNPNDVPLIISQADIYYKLNDITNYKKIINEALEKDPTNEVLFFNLGVVSVTSNQFEDAEKYYKKAIELKPTYVDAYLNLSDLTLKPDAKIVEEMNKLGTNVKDQKRYDVLKAERQQLFNKAMPLLEKAHELDPKNDVVKSNLRAVYSFLELTDKVKALKAEQ